MSTAVADQTYRDVMTVDAPAAATPFEQATRNWLFGEVWNRPGLTRRERRWITLTCVAAADAPQPMADHVYAALNSDDIELAELLEFVLHFAVYCGWPKASAVERHIREQWTRVCGERGQEVPELPQLPNESLGPNDWEERLQRGAEEFVDVNLVPSPGRETPYQQAGILNFVFGHVWQRPGLTRRDRRFITVASVALDDAPMPLFSHVTSALHSGDITKEEMDELVLHFSAYYGFAKGQQLALTAEDAWARKPA